MTSTNDIILLINNMRLF